MTVYIDPVIGAALVHLGLPILPALPCPTCGGRSEFRDDMFGSSPCPDCTDGVWTPPDSPVPIGVTSAEPVRVGRLGPQGPYVNWRDRRRNQGWGWVLDTKGGARYPIVLSSMIGSANLRALPIVDESEGVGPGVWVVPDRKSRGIYPKLLLATEDESAELVDISAALVFGKFEPGGVALYATDFTQSVECPECHGYCCLPIRLGSDGLFGGGGRCPSCLGTGRLSCPFPVDDAPDRPCVLEAA